MFDLFDEDASARAALPQGFEAGECEHELVMRCGLDGGYGETRLYAWRGQLVGITRSSILEPFERVALISPARLERDGLNTHLILPVRERGEVELPVMVADRERIAALVEAAPRPSAPPAPESIAEPEPEPEPEPEVEPGPELEPGPDEDDLLDDLLDGVEQELEDALEEGFDWTTPVMELDALPEGASRRLGSHRLQRWGREGRGNTLRALTFAARDQVVVGACDDEQVRAWSIATGEVVRALDHRQRVTCLGSAPGGRLLAAGCEHGEVALWDLATSERRARFEAGGRVGAVGFSSDGAWLAAASQEGVALWSVGQGKLVELLERPGEPLRALAVGAQAQVVFAMDEAGVVWRWGREGRGQRAQLHRAKTSRFALALAPDARALAIVDGGRALVLDARLGQVLAERAPARGEATCVRWSDEEDVFLIGTAGGAVEIYETSRRTVLQEIEVDEPVEALALDEAGRRLAAGRYNVGLWKLPHAEPLFEMRRHHAPIVAVHISPAGREIATSARDGQVLGWDARSGELRWELRDGYLGVISPDERTLAVARRGGIALWDTREDRELGVLEGARGQVRELVFSQDADLLAAGLWSDRVSVWDLERRQLSYHLEGHGGDVEALAFSPSGDLLATGGRDGNIRLWGARSGDLEREIDAHADGVHSLTFAPNGQLFASAGEDGRVRLWDRSTGMEVFHWELDAPALCLDFDPAGEHLAAGDRQGRLLLWDLGSGDRVLTRQAHRMSLTSVDFARDTALLVTASADMSALLWDVPALLGRG